VASSPPKASLVPWTAALLAVASLAAALYVGVPMLRDERASAEAARREAAQAQTRALDAEQARRALEGRLRALEEEARTLTEERNALRELAANDARMTAELDVVRKALEARLTQELKKGEAQLRPLPGARMRVDIASSLLFASGDSALALSGQQVLLRLASALETLSPSTVHVFARSEPSEAAGSTWGLAANRAVSVVRFISENGSLPAGRLVASGYGPKVDAQDPGELRGRVEILITPGRMAPPAEAPTPPKPSAAKTPRKKR